MDVTGNGQVQAAVDRAQIAGEGARLRSLQEKRAPHTRDDLAKTAREFESVFLNMMLGAMRQTVPDSDLMGGSATRMYRQMHDAEMAKVLAGTGDGFGIAKLLESQFASQFAAEEDGGLDDTGATVAADGGDGLLAGAKPGHGLPAQLALDRYRQIAARGVGGDGPRPVTTRDIAPFIAPAPTPTQAADREPNVPAAAPPAVAADIDPRTPGRDTPPPAALPATMAEPAPVAREASPVRVGLVPTDLRLSDSGLVPAEADTVARFGAHIEKSAAAAGLDPRLVLAVVMEESGGNPSARSPVGARGLMQLMPGTARQLGVHNALDPAANLAGGSRYLSEQLERFDGRLDLALAAYNAGPGAVDRAGGRVPGFRETRGYVQRVMARYERIKGGTELDTGQR
jgi:soluble lytic murein transglycosylase-like protein/Rod binding domain-containing protein